MYNLVTIVDYIVQLKFAKSRAEVFSKNKSKYVM